MFYLCSEALPFFLLLIDLSKASALAKIAFKSRNRVSANLCTVTIVTSTTMSLGGSEGEHRQRDRYIGSHHDPRHTSGSTPH